jgi:hypothetical protein
MIRPHTSLGGLSPSELLAQHSGGHARPSAAALSEGSSSSTTSATCTYPSIKARV